MSHCPLVNDLVEAMIEWAGSVAEDMRSLLDAPINAATRARTEASIGTATFIARGLRELAEALDILGPKRNGGWRHGLVAGLEDFVTGVSHVWMRPDPDNDEVLLSCEPTDEGAEPWTTVTL